jgi:cupin superfamily acireductone dioxygenase involved in methionine salvage
MYIYYYTHLQEEENEVCQELRFLQVGGNQEQAKQVVEVGRESSSAPYLHKHKHFIINIIHPRVEYVEVDLEVLDQDYHNLESDRPSLVLQEHVHETEEYLLHFYLRLPYSIIQGLAIHYN